MEAALSGAAEEVRFDFAADVEDGWDGPGLRLATVQTAEPEKAPVPAFEAAPPWPLPLWAREVARPEPAPPRPLAPSRPASEEPAVRSPLGPDDGLRFRRGRIVHRLLQSLPDVPADQRTEVARRFLARSSHRLDAQQQTEILAETLAVLEHPDFAALYGPDSRAEVPIVGMVEGVGGTLVVSGQVDRLVVSERTVKIVDYKTNRPVPSTEGEVPALYLGQMAAYRAVLAGIYPDRRIEGCLLWTEGPRIIRLSDALLADHAP
jgi:ATP-dependent helicase/nuclease subunit A